MTDETPDDIQADLQAAFAEHAKEVPETPVEATQEDDQQTEEPEAPSGPERDEHGRFKSKEAKEEASVEAAPAPNGAEEQGEVAPDPYGLPPQYAKAAIRAKWKELDPEVRRELIERERETHQALTRNDEERTFGRSVKQVVAPYEEMIRSLGADVPTALNYLLNADATLRRGSPEQKLAMFQSIARDYNVPVGQPTGEQPQIDPRLETMQQRIDRLERERNADMQARREAEQGTIQQQIADFASRPDRPYFQQLQAHMSALLQGGVAQNLEEAYDQAVMANPETRALHLAAMRETEDRKRTADANAAAKAARRASPSVTGAPANGVPAQILNGSSNSVEDDLRAAFSQVAGRA